jgi:hypothetical protein
LPLITLFFWEKPVMQKLVKQIKRNKYLNMLEALVVSWR